jgi:hypothetical protein
MTETKVPNTIQLSFTGRVLTGVAGGTIKPGYLIKRNSSNALIAQDVAGGCLGAIKVAFEKEHVGLGTIAGNDSRSNNYASGEQVWAGIPNRGDRVQLMLKGEENVVIGDRLVAHSDGTVKKVTVDSGTFAGAVVGEVIEALNLTGLAAALVKVEIA